MNATLSSQLVAIELLKRLLCCLGHVNSTVNADPCFGGAMMLLDNNVLTITNTSFLGDSFTI